jgi:hypothetical protein
MNKYGEVEVWLYSFLTSALDGGEWSASRPNCFFTVGEIVPGTLTLTLLCEEHRTRSFSLINLCHFRLLYCLTNSSSYTLTKFIKENIIMDS